MKRLRYIITDLYKYTSILCLFFTAIASLYSNTANKIGLYIAIPITCILCTLLNKGFRFNLYEKILYLLFAWDFIAYIWASDRELAAMELHMILGAFFLVYSISILARYKELIPYLYFIYILLYISAWNYAYHNILIFMVDNSDRLNDENLNANTLAYYTFYVSFASYVLSIVSEKKIYKKLWSFIFWVMIPISFGVSILTASRQVLIIQIPLYLLLLYIRLVETKLDCDGYIICVCKFTNTWNIASWLIFVLTTNHQYVAANVRFDPTIIDYSKCIPNHDEYGNLLLN